MSLMEKEPLLTTDEAIEYLRISKATCLKLIHKGDIKAVRVGKGWRIFQSELYRFLEGSRANGARPQP